MQNFHAKQLRTGSAANNIKIMYDPHSLFMYVLKQQSEQILVAPFMYSKFNKLVLSLTKCENVHVTTEPERVSE